MSNIIKTICCVISTAFLLPNVANSFTLSDIPDIKNKRDITLVAERGFWTEHLREEMIPKFTAHTGVAVKIVDMSLGEMYEGQLDSLRDGLGHYDLISIEAGWAKEWAANGYTVPLLEIAREHDPEGEASMKRFLEPYYPSLLKILSYRGQYHSIPYNNYVMGNHYRADLFEHEDERKNFKKRYGYDLVPPEGIRQLLDVSEFFTRKSGQRLAGKILDAPFYGLALMSGLKPHINDEFSAMLWGLGGAWFRPNYPPAGELLSYQVEANSKIVHKVANTYIELLKYAHPADKDWAFLESANALAEGHVAMWPFAYNNLWPISAKLEQNIPGSKIGVSEVPLQHPYVGAYSVSVSYDSRNPEASYWLLKYIGSLEGQKAYALGGGNPCRTDVVLDPVFSTEEKRLLSGAFKASHEANLGWSDGVLQQGHFTSTAMGKIYPELMKTTYAIAHKIETVDEGLDKLAQKIKKLQIRYGEVTAISQ